MTTTTIRLPDTVQDDVVRPAVLAGLETLKLWRSRARQRQHLNRLTSEQLDDIGISVSEAIAEVAKPMWRA